MIINAVSVKRELKESANPEKAKAFARYFKTGRGEYGEGDKFIGLMSAGIGEMIRKYKGLPLSEIKKLLEDEIHECRSIALGILCDLYRRGENKEKKIIVDFYLKNLKRVNNWDLVDGSAPSILGNFLLDKNKKILYKLVKSKNLWERRIAIMATFAFIKINQFDDTFKIAEILLNNKEDLIHKAVGWMLREVGKKDQKEEEKFLKKYAKTMPRTMLRYAIERFPQEKRKYYLLQKSKN